MDHFNGVNYLSEEDDPDIKQAILSHIVVCRLQVSDLVSNRIVYGEWNDSQGRTNLQVMNLLELACEEFNRIYRLLEIYTKRVARGSGQEVFPLSIEVSMITPGQGEAKVILPVDFDLSFDQIWPWAMTNSRALNPTHRPVSVLVTEWRIAR